MKTILLSLLCGGLAAGGFFAGMAWRDRQAADQETVSQPSVKRVTASDAAAKTGPGAASDKAVADFFAKYGIGKGPLSAEKMKAAAAEALSESDPVKGQLLFARLMEELTAENAPEVLAMIREKGGMGPESFGYMRMLAHTWGGIDAAGAMAKMAEGNDRGGRFSQGFVLGGWAAKDPQAAIKWLADYEGDEREKGMMGSMLINGLARSNPEEAMAYANTLTDKNAKSDASRTIAAELIRSGSIDAATDYLKGLTDPSMKEGAFQAIAGQLAGSDPKKAAELIKAHANSEYAAGPAGDLARRLGQDDPKAGLAFAAELPGKTGASATGEVIRDWMRRDDQSEVASKYVADMKPGLAKDGGAAAIARSIVRDDVASALAWTSSIQDPETKTETLMDVGARYAQSDRAAFDAWLPTSGLTAEQQQKTIEQSAERGRGWGGPGGGGPPGGGRGGFGRGMGRPF